jgi:iron(III) transport system substrate-binding protein
MIMVLGLALGTLLGGCPPPDDGDIRVTVTGGGESARELSREEVVALARREAEVWWYTSLPEEQAEAFLERFERAHPYITPHLVRGSTFEIVRRIDRELARGDVRADSLHVLDPAAFDDLRRRGELYAHDSTHARLFPPEYQDPEYWTAMRAVTIGMAYDPGRLSADEVPDTWLELLEPKWEGRIGLKDAQTGGSAYSQYYLLREEYGLYFWREMAAQRPQLFRSSSDTLRALTSGEIDLAGGILGYSVYGAAEEGMNVAPVWPEDGVPMTIGPIAALSRAPHPHAAMVFMDWALSEDGQQAIVEISNCYSLREEVAPPPGRPRLSEINVMAQHGSWTEYRTRQERLQSEYGRLFHPESE